MGDGKKFSSRAAARTRSAVSGRTGCGTAPGDSTRDTVAMDTPAARATSLIVATWAMIVFALAEDSWMKFGASLPLTATNDTLALRDFVQALDGAGFDLLTT